MDFRANGGVGEGSERVSRAYVSPAVLLANNNTVGGDAAGRARPRTPSRATPNASSRTLNGTEAALPTHPPPPPPESVAGAAVTPLPATVVAGPRYYVSNNTKSMTWERPQPLPDGWEMRRNPSSRVYYVDHNSRS